jgi:hypothetical protein
MKEGAACVWVKRITNTCYVLFGNWRMNFENKEWSNVNEKCNYTI